MAAPAATAAPDIHSPGLLNGPPRPCGSAPKAPQERRYPALSIVRPQRASAASSACARIDPARALGGGLLLPERRLRLQVVHQELAGLERVAAVRRGDHHQHDLVARLQRADAMDHAHAADVEAPARLVDHRLDRALGHAGVVLELHRRHAGAVVAVAHRADEAGHGADLRSPSRSAATSAPSRSRPAGS